MLRPVASILCLTLGVVGCGGAGNVSGKVYYQDVAVPAGRVSFQQGNKVIDANIDNDGSYKAVGVPTGEVKIAAFPPTGATPVDAKGAAMMKGMQKTVGKEHTAEAVAAAPKAIKLPPQYLDFDKSGLTLVVKSGDNPPFDIKLK